jgi:hypothetical protein
VMVPRQRARTSGITVEECTWAREGGGE